MARCLLASRGGRFEISLHIESLHNLGERDAQLTAPLSLLRLGCKYPFPLKKALSLPSGQFLNLESSFVRRTVGYHLDDRPVSPRFFSLLWWLFVVL